MIIQNRKKLERRRIGIIGAGNMGEALLSGFLRSKKINAEDILVSEKLGVRSNYISRLYGGIRCVSDSLEVVRESDFVIVAVKPKDVTQVLNQIKKAASPDKVIISIAAGITLNHISSVVGSKAPVVRAMPNAPAFVGEGAVALSRSDKVSEKDLAEVVDLFELVGRVVVVEERFLNAVTGLSGSGPAYVYEIINALAEGGTEQGLKKDDAILLAAQTVMGAAKMVLETKKDPSELRDMVTTPGGTTIEGLMELEKGNLRVVLIGAISKASRRAEELEESAETLNYSQK